MDTTKSRIPKLKELGSGEYVFVLEKYELAFRKDTLNEITDLWNWGMKLEDIAREYTRKPEEVFFALFHQADEGEVTRPYAYVKGE